MMNIWIWLCKDKKYSDQSTEHLNVPTNATLRPTNQQENNQPTSQSMVHQPTNQIKLLPTDLSVLNTNIYVFIIKIG